MTSVHAPIELTRELPRERAPEFPRELTRNPLVKATLRARWPQFVMRAIGLGVLAVIAGVWPGRSTSERRPQGERR